MDISKIIDSIEKLLRYIIPGFIFTLFFKIAYPSNPITILNNIDKTEFYIYMPLVGIVIYGFHRIIFEYFDLLFYKIKNTNRYEVIKKNHKNIKNILPYLDYKWAILHSSLITIELFFLFTVFFHECKSIFEQHRCLFTYISIFLFIITMISYFMLHYDQEKLRDNPNNSKN